MTPYILKLLKSTASWGVRGKLEHWTGPNNDNYINLKNCGHVFCDK